MPVTSPCVVVLDGFLDAGNAAELAAQHLSDLADGPVVATFDVDALHDYRARRPAMSFVRDHYSRLRRAPAGGPAAARHRRHAVPAAAGPEPDIRWEAFARAVREVVERFDVTSGREHGRRADGGAAHPADRDHPPRQPPRPRARREPVAGRAAGPGERAGAAGGPAGGVGQRRPGLRRAHPALPRADGLPPGRARAARARRDRPVASPSTSAALREAAEDHARPRSTATSRPTRRSATVVARARAAVRRLPRAEAAGSQPAGQRRSRCPPARRSAEQFERSWPASTAAKDNGDDAGGWDGR